MIYTYFVSYFAGSAFGNAEVKLHRSIDSYDQIETIVDVLSAKGVGKNMQIVVLFYTLLKASEGSLE